jgi:hypothetical protein
LTSKLPSMSHEISIYPMNILLSNSKTPKKIPWFPDPSCGTGWCTRCGDPAGQSMDSDMERNRYYQIWYIINRLSDIDYLLMIILE